MVKKLIFLLFLRPSILKKLFFGKFWCHKWVQHLTKTKSHTFLQENDERRGKNGDRRSKNGFFAIFGAKYIKNYFLDTPKNDSGVMSDRSPLFNENGSEEKDTEEWQNLQRMYSKTDANSSNNNSNPQSEAIEMINTDQNVLSNRATVRYNYF